jgi:hypothetical protein
MGNRSRSDYHQACRIKKAPPGGHLPGDGSDGPSTDIPGWDYSVYTLFPPIPKPSNSGRVLSVGSDS